MDFNNGPPVTHFDSMYSIEGCASVCDFNGNLLFYASPEKAWDRNNNVMPNGNGLLGQSSSTQGAAIIQSFSDPNKYYLFSLESNDAQTGYLYYSLVDMSLNGGLGDIVANQKNIRIDSNMSEKMIVVKGNGCCHWLVLHDRSDHIFHSFKIDYGGINLSPVISNSGFTNSPSFYMFGEMKGSPNDSSLALVNKGSGTIELYSFNAATGSISNAIPLDTFVNSDPYGITYSPDGSKLYTGPYSVGVLHLFQYDMSLLPDIQAVRNSQTIVANIGVHGTRIGPDNKVYIIANTGLAVINSPNLAVPACNFVPNILSFNSPTALKTGLGNSFFPSPVVPVMPQTHDTAVCLGLNIISLPAPSGYNTYLWSDGITTQSDTFSTAGTKWVVSSSFCGVRVDTFHVQSLPIVVSSGITDTTICLVNNIPTLSAQPGYIAYLWSDGKTTQSDTMSQPGTKWAQAQTGCDMLVDTFKLHAMPIASTSVVIDTTVCLVNNVPVFSGPAGNTYLWSDGKAAQTDTMSQPGTKWVQAQTGCNMIVDTFKLHAMAIATTGVVKDTNVCLINNIPILTAEPGYNTYLWSDGKTIQQDSISLPGTKWVQCQTGCTMQVDTFHVHDWRDTTKMVTDTSHCVAYSPIPVVAPGGYTSYLWNDGKIGQADTFFSTSTKWVTALNGCNMLVDTVHFTATTIPQDSVFEHNTDTMICFEAGSVTVNAPGGYTLYLWSDGVNTQSDVFNNAGTKWVYAQKLCYLLIDTFSVLAKPTDTLMGKVDTMTCFSSGTTLSAVQGYDTYLWSDGNAGITDTFSQTSTKRVYAHRACEERIDTFHVQFINDLSVDLGADTAICKGESVQLNATSTYNTARYLWQDGKTSPTYTVTEGGDYSVKVSVGPCSVEDTIRVHQKIIDIKLKDGLIPCHEESVTLDAGVDNASYLWQDGSTQRTYKATKEGSYSVKVTQDECSASATATVRFEGCPCNVVIPTAFSPNNDGRNDKFGLTVSCAINSFKLMVYNRWGNQVFYSEDVNQKWDGTMKGIPVDGDVFNYYLEFKDGDNKTYSYKGNVTLVR
ncbi:MAG: gliding motility-associated C-terminal domain-containing protein [Bacteroidetes bacterium]|nr:gliding motility-associated C-terminal domain-containing protein [Bacteroidota bacterium]